MTFLINEIYTHLSGFMYSYLALLIFKQIYFTHCKDTSKN